MFSWIEKKRAGFGLVALFLWAFTAAAHPVVASEFASESPDKHYQIETVASPGGIIWGMDFIAPNKLLFTQRDGRMGLLLTDRQTLSEVFGGPEVFARGQGGLLDISIEPESDWIYFTYANPVGENQGATTLGRAWLRGHALKDWQDLLVTNTADSGSRHFGSRIAFDGKGYVYFSVGDRGERKQAQDLASHAGKILRLNLDGSVPVDNPYVNKLGAKPEIWSYGHRNPQGLAFDAATNRLWSIEHGPRGGDEINLIKKGRNYGWPEVSYGREYMLPIAVGEGVSKPGMTSPAKVYIPSIAPSSLLLYTGPAFPDWQGQLFAGALKLQHINRVAVNKQAVPVSEVRMLEQYGQRIRALAQNEDGWIYFSTDSGDIARIRPISSH